MYQRLEATVIRFILFEHYEEITDFTSSEISKYL